MHQEQRKETLFKALSFAKKFLKEQGYHPFVVVIQGSQNYNMDIYSPDYQSDIDIKAFVLPSFKDVYHNTTVNEAIKMDRKGGIALMEVKDIRLLSEMLAKMNTSYLELMVSEFFVTDYREDFQSMKDELPFLLDERFALIVKSLVGMSKEKEKAFNHPYPSVADKIEKYGYDPKQLHHIVRIRHMLHSLINKEASYAQVIACDNLTENEMKFLLDVKQHPKPLIEAEAIRDENLGVIRSLYEGVDLGSMPITSDSLYRLKSIVEEVIKRHLTFILNPRNSEVDVQLIKGTFKSLPTEAKQHLLSVDASVDDSYMVEMLRITRWDIQNYWKK